MKLTEQQLKGFSKYVRQWRVDMIDDHNQNFVGKNYHDIETLIAFADATRNDLGKLFQMVDLIATHLADGEGAKGHEAFLQGMEKRATSPT